MSVKLIHVLIWYEVWNGDSYVEAITMATGTVKWFNPTKGYGFIEPEDGGQDAFVHISAVERAGLHSLSEGQKISYDLVPGQNGKSAAENLKEASGDNAADEAGDDTEDDDDADDKSGEDAEVTE